MAEKTRDYLFDNIRSLMLILVVAGHTIDPFIESQDSLFRYIMQYIYLFHMPMFAFVTGYFTKDTERAWEGAVKKVLVPYIVIQTAYILMAEIMMWLGLVSYNGDVFKPSIFLPTSPLFYLLSVFLWKVFAKDIDKLRFPVLFSVVSGVLISIMNNDSFHMAYGSTFSLMVFYVLGTKCTKKHIEKIRNMPRLAALCVMLAGIIPSVYLPYNFRNVRFTYHYVGLDNLEGILYRLLFYCIALMMMAAIINLMPSKKNVFSKIGANSIIVYAGSTFTAPFLYLMIAARLSLSTNIYINLLGIIIFSLFITLFFSMDWIRKIYDCVIDCINRVIFKK